jgi:hypothetical protein
MATRMFASWNQMSSWLRELQGSNEPHSQAGREFTNHFELIGVRSSGAGEPIAHHCAVAR